MAKFLYRLGKWSFRAKWVVIVAWVLLLAIFGGLSTLLQRGFVDTFTMSGTPSQQAFEIYEKNFPEAANPLQGTGVNIVFQAPEGQSLANPENTAVIQSVVDRINESLGDHITNTTRWGNPITLNPELQAMIIDQFTSMGLPEENARLDAENLSLVSADKTIAYTTFDFDYPLTADVTDEDRRLVNEALQVGRDAGLTVEANGTGFGDPIIIEETSEIIGVAVAAIILIFTFGSLVAAGMPVLTAIVGVAIGSLATVLATRWFDMNTVTPVLAIMLGLAVGIDYSLFIIFRYRRELKRLSPQEAAGMAVGTAGSAVVFAGITVIVALVALAVANITFLTYMGIAAAFTVFIAVLIALTLVPAVLGLLGRRIFSGELKVLTRRRKAETVTMGKRWVTLVHRMPGLVIAVVIFALGALTVPSLGLHLSLPTDTQSDYSTTQRKAADLMTKGFGAGVNAPMLVVVDAHDVNPDAEILQPLISAQLTQENPTGQERKQAAAFASYMYVIQKYSTNQDMKHLQLVAISDDQLAVQMLLTPTSAPEETSTNQLILSLREQQVEVESATGINTGITGLVPIQQDITNRLSSVMGLYLLIVVGLAIVLLMIIFRSVLVPLVAGVGFLLSIGAAFGVTVLFWQEGLWGLVPTPGPIIAFMPIFLIGVCFGLAMDYQVFLVSAMREHYTHSGGQAAKGSKYTAVEESVIHGFASGARVVTAAALIMIAVFVAFIGQPIPFIKIFGFALGAGVLFDAFFIRMAFMPAAMFILGNATWWMPRWLDKLLPHLDVEGAALEKERLEKAESSVR
ncbi:MMPL family transporter [Corynebacterium kutscheri]|uniref:RND superfamily drug exporter n=1 Tax=Corynebacterium kutscheri TaxID=35755 RepID=A0AB38VQ59_9CORY|nr:MMPL family transporter [Corynebacterium kutscheri]VEH05349.1 RND superfamily drug exporter [Corynebacterium kutscheri]